jgi:uncharacterized protein involved in tellurium resistance
VSRYAKFVCTQCKVQLWLGKAIFQTDSDQPTRFQIGDTRDTHPLNSENPVLNKVLWKMLADHARHPIHIFVEGDPDYDSTAGFVKIGGDESKDITFEQYLEGWSG